MIKMSRQLNRAMNSYQVSWANVFAVACFFERDARGYRSKMGRNFLADLELATSRTFS